MLPAKNLQSLSVRTPSCKPNGKGFSLPHTYFSPHWILTPRVDPSGDALMWRFRNPPHTATCASPRNKTVLYPTHSDCLLSYDALVSVNPHCFLPDFVLTSSDVTKLNAHLTISDSLSKERSIFQQYSMRLYLIFNKMVNFKHHLIFDPYYFVQL